MIELPDEAGQPPPPFAAAVRSILVDTSTKFVREGRATFTDLVSGDRVNVYVRDCKSSGAGANLLARRVVAQPVTGPTGPTGASGATGATGATGPTGP